MTHNFLVTYTAKDGRKFRGVGTRGQRRALRRVLAYNRSLRGVWRSTERGWRR